MTEILTWPAAIAFPQDILLDNQEVWSSSKVETQMESGPPHARLRDTVNFSVWNCKIFLRSTAQRELFKKFWQHDTKNGTIPFVWVDPLTGVNTKFQLVSVNTISAQGAGRHFIDFTIREVPA